MKSKKHLFFWSCYVDILGIRYRGTGDTQQEAELSLNTQLKALEIGGVLCNL